jgi:uncharacterized protein
VTRNGNAVYEGAITEESPAQRGAPGDLNSPQRKGINMSNTEETLARGNGAVLSTAYAAFVASDIESLTNIFDVDVVFHVAGDNWLTGDYAGRDAVLGFFANLFVYSEGNMKLDVHDVIAGDSYTVGLHRSTAFRSDGKSVTTDNVLIARIVNNQISEVWINPWRQKEESEFFGTAVPAGFEAPIKTHERSNSWSPETP